jgi:CRP-like cAMP-binding protein
MKTELPEEVETFRDHAWHRLPELRVESAADAEQLIERAGFCAAMTDARRGGPSLYVAVCGRRDAFMPRNVQKDPESSLAWITKDEVMRRGRVYYAKLARARATFIARRLVPHFNVIWGVPRAKERELLSEDARAILKVLRREWEMATKDLRAESGVTDRARFTRAMDELQRAMKVIPSEVLYEPWFTYIWMLSEGRFAKELASKVRREEALQELARAFLDGAGMTTRGELARVTGLSRPEAGKGNHALVKQGYAERLGVGVYRISDFDERLKGFGI